MLLAKSLRTFPRGSFSKLVSSFCLVYLCTSHTVCLGSHLNPRFYFTSKHIDIWSCIGNIVNPLVGWSTQLNGRRVTLTLSANANTFGSKIWMVSTCDRPQWFCALKDLLWYCVFDRSSIQSP